MAGERGEVASWFVKESPSLATQGSVLIEEGRMVLELDPGLSNQEREMLWEQARSYPYRHRRCRGELGAQLLIDPKGELREEVVFDGKNPNCRCFYLDPEEQAELEAYLRNRGEEQ
jgi:hypothetical protein